MLGHTIRHSAVSCAKMAKSIEMPRRNYAYWQSSDGSVIMEHRVDKTTGQNVTNVPCRKWKN